MWKATLLLITSSLEVFQLKTCRSSLVVVFNLEKRLAVHDCELGYDANGTKNIPVLCDFMPEYLLQAAPHLEPLVRGLLALSHYRLHPFRVP